MKRDWGELALRKIRKIKYSRLFIIIIFAYILLQISINIIGKNIDTLVIESETVELKVSAKGLIIRDEYLIRSNQSGIIKSMVNNGEKLKKGDALAAIYSNSKNLEENKSKIVQLNKEIDELETEYENSKSDISKELINVKIKNKKEQRVVLNDENNKNINYLNITTSGVVSTKYDGYEDIYTLDKLENLTSKDIEDAENNYKELDIENTSIKESEVVARIIQSDYSYIAICTKDDDIFEDNQKVEIVFDSENIQGNVEKIYRNGNDNVVIFKISNQNVEIYDTRVKEFDIIYKQIDGLKVPKQSVKEKNDQKGVYVLNQETKKVDFIELKNIQYEDDEFIFIDYYKNQKEGIKTIDIYDEIILKPNSINKNIKISRW
ncbi:HlyD family efflux transporter periplasmic adaptor subunit [Romboutsia ilealis]|uniref:HlyD family secretion protein n=1 Tax=Romboutsia ilealis TaxID=1115758 RepID=A0A1V1I2Z8_9FIRM|nr:HlyD family efflux transporter periplasmic adaptor subunit [Romboutsia ilealis]CED94578.1 HlyD family secretion protein [Romboutsia ilealis]